MSTDVWSDVIHMIFNTALTLYNSFRIPGFAFSPLSMLIGSTVIVLSIKLLKNLGGTNYFE